MSKVHFFSPGFLYCSGRTNHYAPTTDKRSEVTCKACQRRLTAEAKRRILAARS